MDQAWIRQYQDNLFLVSLPVPIAGFQGFVGAWVLTVGWFGFNVMSAQTITGISGLVAVNSLFVAVIVWGGDWASFRDGPHFELDRTAYP